MTAIKQTLLKSNLVWGGGVVVQIKKMLWKEKTIL